MAGMEGVQVVSLSLGYVMGQALAAAAELGVADIVADGPRSVAEMAAATGADERSLGRLLRTLASGGVFTEVSPECYGLNPMAATLRRDTPDSVRAAVLWVSAPMHYTSCGQLARSVATGQPAFEHIFGLPYFDHLAADPEASRVWDEGMACFSGLENAAIAAAITTAGALPAGACVVDVAGGQGGFLAELLKTDPGLTGILFDRPPVIAGVAAEPRVLEAAGVRARCRLADGDFFEAVPAGGDAYVLKRILHDWDDATCVEILKRCRDVVPATGKLLVIDAVIPPGNDPHPAKIVDLAMMGILGGGERTEDELRALLAAADFRLSRVIPTMSMLGVIEAVPT